MKKLILVLILLMSNYSFSQVTSFNLEEYTISIDSKFNYHYVKNNDLLNIYNLDSNTKVLLFNNDYININPTLFVKFKKIDSAYFNDVKNMFLTEGNFKKFAAEYKGLKHLYYSNYECYRFVHLKESLSIGILSVIYLFPFYNRNEFLYIIHNFYIKNKTASKIDDSIESSYKIMNTLKIERRK